MAVHEKVEKARRDRMDEKNSQITPELPMSQGHTLPKKKRRPEHIPDPRGLPAPIWDTDPPSGLLLPVLAVEGFSAGPF
jgi:hypothetical protein